MCWPNGFPYASRGSRTNTTERFECAASQLSVAEKTEDIAPWIHRDSKYLYTPVYHSRMYISLALGRPHRAEFADFSTPYQAHASASHSIDGHRLVPITLLSRSKLPLSWLDPCPGAVRGIQSGRLFVANIPALEQDLQWQNEPTVLAARLADEPVTPGHEELYVVEKVKRGLYVVCALGAWVEEGDLLVASKGNAGRNSMPTTNYTGSNGNWLASARIDGPFIDSKARKRKGINVSIITSKRSRTPSIDIGQSGKGHTETRSDESVDGDSVVGHNLSAQEVSEIPSIETYRGDGNRHEVDQFVSARSRPNDTVANGQTQEAIFSGLRTQYLDALYISKVRRFHHITIPQSGRLRFFRRLLHTSPKDRYRALVPHSKKETAVSRWSCRIYVPFIGTACCPRRRWI